MNLKFEVMIRNLSIDTVQAHLELSASQYKRNEINNRDFLIWKFLNSTEKPYKIIEIWNGEILLGRIALEHKKVETLMPNKGEFFLLTDLIVTKDVNDPRILFLLVTEIRKLQIKYNFIVFPNQKSEFLYDKILQFKKFNPRNLSFFVILNRRRFARSICENKQGFGDDARPLGASIFSRSLRDFERRFVNVPKRKYIFYSVEHPDGFSQTVIVFRRIYHVINIQVDIVSVNNLDGISNIKFSGLPRHFVAPTQFLAMMNSHKKRSKLRFRIPKHFLPHELVSYCSIDDMTLEHSLQLSDIDVF